MRMLRFRVTGSEEAFLRLRAALESVDHLDRLEEIDDLMPGIRDDSSSLDLPSDEAGEGHVLEAHVTSDAAWERLRAVLENRAMELGLAVEFTGDEEA